MSADSDDEFSPKESTEDSDDGKFLNKKTGEYVPSMVTKTLLFTGIGLGFIIGFLIVAVIVAAGMCMFQTLTVLTADPTSVSGGSADITDNIRSDFTQCTRTSITSPIPIVLGVIGGAIASYPSYKLMKSLSGGNYLRSII